MLKIKRIILIVGLSYFSPFQSKAQAIAPILPGSFQTEAYFPLLKGKRVGLFANHTSMLGKTHLIDTLINSSIRIQKIFTPEHGLRGTADAGEKIADNVDPTTGIKIISLYGKKNAPDSIDLLDIDILLFDIQDVGARFYTYINSLQYFMEAAMANNKPLIVLDRPNPNGHYIDGPVLTSSFASGVGKNAIPIVYGLTIGEYAEMLKGENWLKVANGKSALSLTIIPNKNYTHQSKYILPNAPSPNLPNMHSVYWYPTTCLIEGTVLSEGRGTANAFTYIGHPNIQNKNFSFTPTPRIGAMNSKFYGQVCYGWDLTNVKAPDHIDLELLLAIYAAFPDKDAFFLAPKSNQSKDYFFNKLAGNEILMGQIKAGKTAQEIRASWQPAITAFKKIRKKYLHYPDFE